MLVYGKIKMNLQQSITVRKIKKGNIKAFEKLFKELYAPLCGFAQKFIDDKNKAEELVQDIFYNLWKNRVNLDIKISLKSYLYKSVQNNCLLIIQHKKVEEKYRKHLSITTNSSTQQTPDKVLEIKELNENIQTTLETLPERCREIFYLNRFEGLKYREIAERLSISQKTVEANITKALKVLRKNLTKEHWSI